MQTYILIALAVVFLPFLVRIVTGKDSLAVLSLIALLAYVYFN